MTDSEEFDFDWNARNNAKPLEDRTIVKAAVAAVMEIGPTAEGKAELDAALYRIQREANDKWKDDVKKMAAQAEMFPRCVRALEELLAAEKLVYDHPRLVLARKNVRALIIEARALLP